jgi:MFS family permease
MVTPSRDGARPGTADSEHESLWRSPDFVRVWAGETVSLFGSQITILALPLTAISLLGATAWELGLIGAAGFAPFLLFTLLVGVWIDRWRRRPVMLVANVARGLLLGLVPVLAVLGMLQIWHLVVVGFAVAVCQVFFELAYQSYVPSLVERSRLVEGNAKLQTSAAAAEVGGPGVAGLLIQAVTAPFAVAIDAISFLVSAAAIASVRKPEPAPEAPERERHAGGLLGEIGQGLRLVLGDRHLRAMAGEATTYNLGFTIIETVLLLYVTREVGMSPALVGLIFSVGSVGSLLGATAAALAERRFGFGKAMTASYVLACLPPLLIPLATPPLPVAAAVLVASYLLGAVGVASSQIYVYALRQSITPDRLLGRMNSGYRFFVTGMLPLGALIGGVLGEVVGLRATLLVGAGGCVLALAWILASPIPALDRLPGAGETPAADPGAGETPAADPGAAASR